MQRIHRTVGIAVMLGLAGCSQSPASRPVTLDTASVTPSPTGVVLTPEQQAVADAVARYDKALDTFFRGGPLKKANLTAVAAEPWATTLGNNLFAVRAQNYQLIGTAETKLQGVVISGSSAVVKHCRDDRNLQTVKIGQPNPTGGFGDPPYIGVTNLKWANAKWLVSGVSVGGKCTL
jgi:hypothetical protein